MGHVVTFRVATPPATATCSVPIVFRVARHSQGGSNIEASGQLPGLTAAAAAAADAAADLLAGATAQVQRADLPDADVTLSNTQSGTVHGDVQVELRSNDLRVVGNLHVRAIMAVQLQ